ncbi:MAG: cupin domain-containing protein [Flavonifractor plautii]
MKVMYRKDAEPYVPAGHYDVKCIRLHDQNTSGSEHLIVGVSYFLPNGGGAEYKKVPEDTNLIYYIVSGEMTVTTDEGEFILHAGDSICFQPGDGRSCRNTGMEATTMLVITGK